MNLYNKLYYCTVFQSWDIGLYSLYCGKWRKIKESCNHLDLEWTMPNVKLVRSVSISFNMFKLIHQFLSCCAPAHTHTHTHTLTLTLTHTHTHTHRIENEFIDFWNLLKHVLLTEILHNVRYCTLLYLLMAAILKSGCPSQPSLSLVPLSRRIILGTIMQPTNIYPLQGYLATWYRVLQTFLDLSSFTASAVLQFFFWWWASTFSIV